MSLMKPGYAAYVMQCHCHYNASECLNLKLEVLPLMRQKFGHDLSAIEKLKNTKKATLAERYLRISFR